MMKHIWGLLSLLVVQCASSARGKNHSLLIIADDIGLDSLSQWNASTNSVSGEWIVDADQRNMDGSAEGVEFFHPLRADILFYRIEVSLP